MSTAAIFATYLDACDHRHLSSQSKFFFIFLPQLNDIFTVEVLLHLFAPAELMSRNEPSWNKF